MRALLLAAVTAALAADVVPHCGGPKVDIQSPGQECGAHGPHWRGECRAPGVCESVRRNLPGTHLMCTVECTTDAECTKYGARLTCSGTTDGALPRRVCAPPDTP